MTPIAPKGFWNEDAKEALKPHLVHCAPADAVGALFSKWLRCQCGRCRLNKQIRKGLLVRFGKAQGEPERIPSIRFGPGLLAELAGFVKVGIPIFGVWIVLATPMIALERDHRIGALPATVTIRQEYIVRGASIVDARVQTRAADRKIVIPHETVPSELVKVPEVVKPNTLPAPSGLREP